MEEKLSYPKGLILIVRGSCDEANGEHSEVSKKSRFLLLSFIIDRNVR